MFLSPFPSLKIHYPDYLSIDYLVMIGFLGYLMMLGYHGHQMRLGYLDFLMYLSPEIRLIVVASVAVAAVAAVAEY